MMLFQVLAICLIVHTFLFQFRFYMATYDLSGVGQQPLRTDGEETQKSENFIALNYNERIEKVNLDCVSHIKVEDHYCTVIYLKENKWQQWTVYGKLKTFEEEYPTRLIRINRSVLANPQMVMKVEKSGGKHLIYLKGESTSPYILSSAQKHLLDHLIPVVK